MTNQRVAAGTTPSAQNLTFSCTAPLPSIHQRFQPTLLQRRTTDAMSTCGKTLSRICLNPRQNTSTSAFLPHLQTRHESTTRRHRKLLALPEAPSFTPDRSSPTLIFNPPSAAPSVYHTPLKFLPKEDKRRALYAAHAGTASRSALASRTPSIATPGTPLHTTTFSRPPNSPNTNPSSAFLPPRPSASLPPALRDPYEKKYHLAPSEIAEIQRLRAADPERWTRVRLAEKFGCSQFFVGMVAKHEEKAGRVQREHEKARRKWGKTRVLAREDRGRRKVLWGRDA